jgi:hypothetical protein
MLAGGPSLIPAHGIWHVLLAVLIALAAVVFVLSFFFHLEGGEVVRGGEGKRIKNKIVQKNKGGGDNIAQQAGDNSVQIGKAETVNIGPLPRTLVGRDTSALQSAAEAFKGTNVYVASPMGDAEALSLANEIAALLERHGWDVSRGQYGGTLEVIRGIAFLLPGGDPDAYPWFVPVASGIHEAGLTYAGWRNYNATHPEIRVGGA